MMKNLKKLSIFAFIALFGLTLIRCNDDDPVTLKLYSVSGTVTYPNLAGTTQNADGAIVYLALSDAATTAYDFTTVADASGDYSFDNLDAGDYFMFVNYNTANLNNGARIDGINFDSGEGVLFTVGEDATQDVALVSAGQATDFVVDTRTAGDWIFDGSHSNVNFEFPYDESNSTYVGRFNDFEIEVFFDPADLSNGIISASIDLLSANTSSRGGRDSFYDDVLLAWDFGCIRGTFGVTDTNGTPDEGSRYATFEATGFTAYGDGYNATGTFTLNGETNQETLFFRLVEGFEALNRQSVLTRYSSFEGLLEFEALNDYLIDSGHVGSETVSVYISNQVNVPVVN